MRYVAPPRDAVDPAVFARLPLAGLARVRGLLEGERWPSIDALNALRAERTWPSVRGPGRRRCWPTACITSSASPSTAAIATREGNWHDLLNALVWLRHPALKRALNRRQMAEIARMGPDAALACPVRTDPFRRRRRDRGCARSRAAGAVGRARLARPVLATAAGVARRRDPGRAVRPRVARAGADPQRLLVGKALVFQCSGDTDMADARWPVAPHAIATRRAAERPAGPAPTAAVGHSGLASAQCRGGISPRGGVLSAEKGRAGVSRFDARLTCRRVDRVEVRETSTMDAVSPEPRQGPQMAGQAAPTGAAKREPRPAIRRTGSMATGSSKVRTGALNGRGAVARMPLSARSMLAD